MSASRRRTEGPEGLNVQNSLTFSSTGEALTKAVTIYLSPRLNNVFKPAWCAGLQIIEGTTPRKTRYTILGHCEYGTWTIVPTLYVMRSTP